jgi:hypothetical protein
MKRLLPACVVVVGIAGSASPSAALSPGDPAPPFTKNELISTPFPQTGPPRTLADYAGRVLILHLLGYS